MYAQNAWTWNDICSIQVQQGELIPFIDEILNNLNSIICDLQSPQVHVFYEAIGFLISAQQDTQIQDNLIERLMVLPNTVWDELTQAASRVGTNSVKLPPVITVVSLIVPLFNIIGVVLDVLSCFIVAASERRHPEGARNR